jgi:hypothetical protein
MDSELALMNEENCSELDMMNEENNAILITSSINLTDEVKNIFEDLIIESFRHQDYQRYCFEKLIKVWLGENFLAASSPSLDIKKETDRFNDCKTYIFKTIAKHLPDGEDVIYSEYNSLIKNGNITVCADGECTIYDKKQIDVRLFSNYIGQLKRKILRQYDILKHNFGVYLTEKMEDAEFDKINNEPVIADLRRSARITKTTDYRPMFSWNKTKTKKTIKDFLKTNTTSNTTSKKRKVNPFNDLYLQYIFDFLLYIT